MSVPLWIADSRNHGLLLAAIAQIGIALASDDRLRDWDEAIAVWASQEHLRDPES